MNSRLYILVSIVLVVGALAYFVPIMFDDRDLRIADFGFGSSKSGTQNEHPQLKLGDTVWLLFKVRGCTPSGGECKGTLTVSIKDPKGKEMPLVEESTAQPFSFKKRSSITHLDYNERFPLGGGEPGAWKLHIEATDEVAHKTAVKDVDFTVTAR